LGFYSSSFTMMHGPINISKQGYCGTRTLCAITVKFLTFEGICCLQLQCWS